MFYRKWKIKNAVVLDVGSAAHLQAFLIKQGVLFFARLQCFRRVQRLARLICQSLLYKFIFSYWLWKEWQNNTKVFSITQKMKKLYCIISGTYRKFEKPKMSYLLEKTLVLSVIHSKCKNEGEKNILERRFNWDIKNSWFNWKYVITFKYGWRKHKSRN